MDRKAIQRDKQGAPNIDREHFYKLAELNIEDKLKASPYGDVTEEELEQIACVKLECIDVDKIYDDTNDARSATFFQPSRPIDDGLKEVLSRHWLELGEGQALRVYAEYKGRWFANPWDEVDRLGRDKPVLARFGGTAWQRIEGRWEVEESTRLILPQGRIFLGQDRGYDYRDEYSSDIALFPKDKSKPHLACIISDTIISHDTMLRSEVHGAVALIMYQLARRPFVDHDIKPVMVYTFQSDQYARITQAYLDRGMGKIVLRQSRQFDLRGPKPTDDAWLLLRWMLNTPVGDTVVKKEEYSLPIRVKESALSPVKPKPIEVSAKRVTLGAGEARGIRTATICIVGSSEGW